MKLSRILLGIIALVTIAGAVYGWRSATSQQTTPTFAGVSQEKLEEQGIFLTLPEQAQVPDTIPEAQAREVATNQFGAAGGLRVKESVLAILVDKQPAPGYNGPVWVFNIDPATAPGLPGGPMGNTQTTVTDAFLIFMNARNGDFLFSSQWAHKE